MASSSAAPTGAPDGTPHGASAAAAGPAPSPLLLAGVAGSPYTRKMLALLRYRHLPYRWIQKSRGVPGLPVAKPPLLPTFYLPDDSGTLQAVTDSTPLIRRFEAAYPGRHAVPANPALALIDALIEDYADEWLTKAMFHYRWHFADDIEKAGLVLPNWALGPLDDATLASHAQAIRDRQMPRLRYVGSNAQTWALIEASYLRFLGLMEAHLSQHRFWLGARPGAGDFGVFGQLTQLAQFDPTPTSLAARLAPRVTAWVGHTEDLSGLEPSDADWFDPAALPATVTALLAEIGRVYPPLLRANAQALQAGEAQFSTTIDDQPWTQQSFAYQGKCLAWLRRDHQALCAADRAVVDKALAGTGCEALFG